MLDLASRRVTLTEESPPFVLQLGINLALQSPHRWSFDSGKAESDPNGFHKWGDCTTCKKPADCLVNLRLKRVKSGGLADRHREVCKRLVLVYGSAPLQTIILIISSWNLLRLGIYIVLHSFTTSKLLDSNFLLGISGRILRVDLLTLLSVESDDAFMKRGKFLCMFAAGLSLLHLWWLWKYEELPQEAAVQTYIVSRVPSHPIAPWCQNH